MAVLLLLLLHFEMAIMQIVRLNACSLSTNERTSERIECAGMEQK